jgi:hypothetical protein
MVTYSDTLIITSYNDNLTPIMNQTVLITTALPTYYVSVHSFRAAFRAAGISLQRQTI